MANQINCNDSVPTFRKNDFFRTNESVYVHVSTEYPDFVGVLHKHEFIEVVYVLSGTATHFVGAKSYDVRRDDIIIINANTPHKFQATDSNEEFRAYDLMFTPDFFDASNINMVDFQTLKKSFLFGSIYDNDEIDFPDMKISTTHTNGFKELFTRIYNEYYRRDRGYLELIRAYVIQLIISFFRCMEDKARISVSQSQIEVVNSAIAYMQENYNESLSIDEIAAKVFLNRDYFRRLFKSVTGMSITFFLQKIKINEACRFLTDTNKSIEEIIDLCGYSDRKNFYESFKKIIGKTPGVYRKENTIRLK